MYTLFDYLINLFVIAAKRKIWNIWCYNDNEKYGKATINPIASK